MNKQVKSAAKRLIPERYLARLRPIMAKCRHTRSTIRQVRARRAFVAAPETADFLGLDVLEEIEPKNQSVPTYCYDPESLVERGKRRADYLLALLSPKLGGRNMFLEIGARDGMVCCALQEKGMKTTATDISTRYFDGRAAAAGVALLEMDAANMQFADESFDVIFSNDVFEHLAQPEAVLKECIRVAKKGGYIYITAGPLYMSSRGQHGCLSTPYVQFLFSKETISTYIEKNGLRRLDFGYVNEWTAEQFRGLWAQYADRVETIKYTENLNLSSLNLVVRYPALFRSRTGCFDNLVVSSFEVLFRKTV